MSRMSRNAWGSLAIAGSGLLFAATAFIGQDSAARASACRPAWMAADVPAFCSWRAEPALPEARAYHAVATYDDQIYVLGGYRVDTAKGQIDYYDSVIRSSVGADGYLSAWSYEPAMNNARAGAAAAAVGDCLFLTGGSSSTSSSLTYYDDVQSAHIRKDGRLSPWVTSPNHLNTARSNHSLVIARTSDGMFLEAVAGVTQAGDDTVHLDTIETAKIGTDCAVGEWKLAHYHLKGGRSTPQALAVRNNLVVIGGWGDLDLIDIYNDVQVSAPRIDGSPSPWRTSPGRLATGIYGDATVVAMSPDVANLALLLSLGGQPGVGAYSDWISFAYVSPNGAVADAIALWRIAPSGRLPTARAGLGVSLVGDRVYVIGGNDADGRYDSDVVSAQFDFGQP
jgi:N-acetylneuraminic acid mutarotase